MKRKEQQEKKFNQLDYYFNRLFPMHTWYYDKDKHNHLMGRLHDWSDVNFNIFLSHFENASLVTKVNTDKDYQYTYDYIYRSDLRPDMDRETVFTCRSCWKQIDTKTYQSWSETMEQKDWYYVTFFEDDGSTGYRIWCYECEQDKYQEKQKIYSEFYSKLFEHLLLDE